jgi:translocator protein
MNTSIVWRWLVMLATLATITMNGLANALPLNGLNTGEISDRFNIFFVPAGYVFSIWGLIYLGLLAYSLYQLLPSQRGNLDLGRISGLYLLSCLFNCIWLICWHYELFSLTIVMMLGLLLSLIGIYLRLDVGRKPVSAGMRWFVHLPFSIYLGWVSVATIANASQLLEYLGWQGGGISAQVWAVIMLIVAVLLGAAMAFIRKDAGFLLVQVWAFAGIGIAQADASLVASGAWIATLVAAGLAIWSGLRAVQNQRVRPV